MRPGWRPAPPPPRTRSDGPDILRAAAVGHEVQRFAAGGPHRPRVLRAAFGHLGVHRCRARAGCRRGLLDQPDLALVEMAVPLAPPLRAGVRARRDRQRVAARRGRREVLRRVAIGGGRHRRAALGAHAIDVEHARHFVAVRRQVHELPVRRPAGHQLVRIVEGQPRQIAARERQDVHVAATGARGGERQTISVWRKQRPRFRCGMRHQQPRIAAARGHFPDVAAADEGDRRAVGGDPRLGEGRQPGDGVGRRRLTVAPRASPQRSRAGPREQRPQASCSSHPRENSGSVYDPRTSTPPVGRARL